MQPLRFRRVIVAALSLVLFGGADALASPPRGDELLLLQEIPAVFSASKYEQKVTEAPSAVSIVTADEIKRYGYRTLADILRSLRSFHPSGNRSIQLLGARGFTRPGDSNGRMLLLINGHRTNDNIFNAAAIDTSFLLDVDLIERIEVVRGPSSSLYGTNAFFGIINVITRRGRDLEGLEVAGEGGTHETFRERLSYGDRLSNGLEVLLSGTHYESDGNGRLYYREFDTPATNNGIAEESDGNEFDSFFGRVSFADVTLEGAYLNGEKQIPTAPYGTEFNDPHTKGGTMQSYLQMTYEHHFASQMDILARASYNRWDSFGDYAYDYAINKDRFRGAWRGGELQVTKALGRHRLIGGGEYQDNFRQDQKNYDLDVYLDTENSSRNWALFAQDEFALHDNWRFNLGVRHDHYDTFGGTTNPRLAVIYTPREKTTLKFLVGEAFHAPSAFELYYHDGLATQKPNPDLDPETIRTYELVWEEYFDDHLRGMLSAFYYEIDDLVNLALDPADGLLYFENLDEAEAKGLEAELEGNWARLEGRVSYTFQQAEDRQGGGHLSNSPKHLAKLNLTVPLIGDSLLLGLEEQYTGKRKTVTGGRTGGYAVTNLTLFGQQLVEGLEVSASVYNLFDKKFSDPVSAAFLQDTIEQDGQAFRFKLSYTF